MSADTASLASSMSFTPQRSRLPSRSRKPASTSVRHSRYTVGIGSPVAWEMPDWVHSGDRLNRERTSSPRRSVFSVGLPLSLTSPAIPA